MVYFGVINGLRSNSLNAHRKVATGPGLDSADFPFWFPVLLSFLCHLLQPAWRSHLNSIHQMGGGGGRDLDAL